MGKIKDIVTLLKLTPEQLKDKDIQKFVLAVGWRQQTGDWYQQWNGNGFVEINKNDGTSIRTILDDKPYIAEYPENIDMNISNRCINNCEFCYQGCTREGKHADIKKFIEDKNSFLYTLHEGTELALNGNEPLHPDLELLLNFCKERGILANLTVNELTLILHKDQLVKWLDDKLIHGIGISPSVYSIPMLDFCKDHPTAVIHTIAGITTKEQYEMLEDKDLKVLVLGYKTFGKGVDYRSEKEQSIIENIDWLKENIKEFVNHFKVVSFDNLAIEQLEPQNWLTPEQWERFYRGNDGSHTLFLDLVNETFAKNSVQPRENHKPLLNDIREMLKDVQNQ